MQPALGKCCSGGLRATLALSLGLGLITAAPAFGETVIAQEQGWTSVSAFGGRVVWSSYRHETKDFVLRTRYQGAISELPVAPRSVAFDVDLGPDAQGRTVAVYSRCRVENSRDPDLAPRYHAASGCDLYLYDFETARERKLRIPAPRRRAPHSQYLPSVWGSRIAFVRQNRLFHVTVAIARLSGGRPRTIRFPHAALNANPRRIELRGHRIAIETEEGSHSCYPPNPRGSVDEGLSSEIWLATVRGQLRRVDRGCTWEKKAGVAAPNLTATGVMYLFTRPNAQGLGDEYLACVKFGERRVRSAPFAGNPTIISRDGPATYFTRYSPQTGLLPVEVVESDPISLGRLP